MPPFGTSTTVAAAAAVALSATAGGYTWSLASGADQRANTTPPAPVPHMAPGLLLPHQPHHHAHAGTQATPAASSLLNATGNSTTASGQAKVPPQPGAPAAASAAASSHHHQHSSELSDTVTGVFHRIDTERAQLRLVQVVFRHGARTPLSRRQELWKGQAWDVCGSAYQAMPVQLYSTSGAANPSNKHDAKQRATVYEGGCAKGELTLRGQAQALELGRWLRARYVQRYAFLDPQLQPGSVVARTTNFSRTIATLRGVLTGLYPEGAKQVTSGAAAPLAVTTSGDLDEILYADTAACPHLSSFERMAKATSQQSLVTDPDYEWARSELVRLLGFNAAAFDTERWLWTDVHDVMTSMAAHGKALPPGMGEVPRLLDTVDRLATKEFVAYIAPSIKDAHGRTVLRLSMGRLLHTLIDNMRAAAADAVAAEQQQGGSGVAAGSALPPRMFLYSGHDSTIMPLLAALGVDVSRWPPYLSNLVLELWELPPARTHAGQVAPADRSSAAGGSGQNAAAAGAPGPAGSGQQAPAPHPAPRFAVRVLYNQQELPLPLCPPGYHTSLSTFEDEVVGPFALSQQDFRDACTVALGHESAMPKPHAASAPGGDE